MQFDTITVDGEDLDVMQYVDVRVQGEMAATVKVDDGTVTVQAIDPNHPEDAHAEYEFPLPDE